MELNWNGALNKNKVVSLPDNGLERIVRVLIKFIQETEMKRNGSEDTRRANSG